MVANLKPVIFLSYCSANKHIANEIDNDFKRIGIQFKRDIRDARYGTSIKDFIKQIAKSDFVLMIISHEYLCSDYCMYEVRELLNTDEFKQRVLPVVLEDAKSIFKPEGRLIYYDYWKRRLNTIAQHRNKYPNEDYVEQYKRANSINDCLDVFFKEITDINVLTLEELKLANYRDLLKIIGFDNEKLIEEVMLISKMTDTENRDLALERFLKEYPSNVFALFQKAYLAVGSRLFKKAKAYYNDVLDVSPFDLAVHNNLAGLLKDQLKEYDEAIIHFEEVIRIDPKNSNAHYNLAIIFQEYLANNEMARFYYNETLKLDPKNAIAHYNFANLLMDYFLDFNGALTHFREAIDINPSDAEANYRLATLLETQFFNFSEAKLYYEDAIRLDHEHEVAKERLENLIKNHFNN